MGLFVGMLEPVSFTRETVPQGSIDHWNLPILEAALTHAPESTRIEASQVELMGIGSYHQLWKTHQSLPLTRAIADLFRAYITKRKMMAEL